MRGERSMSERTSGVAHHGRTDGRTDGVGHVADGLIRHSFTPHRRGRFPVRCSVVRCVPFRSVAAIVTKWITAVNINLIEWSWWAGRVARVGRPVVGGGSDWMKSVAWIER